MFGSLVSVCPGDYLCEMSLAYLTTDHAAEPDFNMAKDEWLMEKAVGMPGVVFVRFYSWMPGAITFGFNQRQASALDFSSVGSTRVIRRITGGRALYHDPSELTYSIALNTDNQDNERLVGTTAHVSASIAGALTDFLTKLGLEAGYMKRSHVGASSATTGNNDAFHTLPCFASHARHEIVSGGRKLIASAQRRIGSTILQHGAIKLGGLVSHPALSRGLEDVIQAGDALPLTLDIFDRLVTQAVECLGSGLNLSISPMVISDDDRNQILIRKNYVESCNLDQRTIKQTVA